MSDSKTNTSPGPGPGDRTLVSDARRTIQVRAPEEVEPGPGSREPAPPSATQDSGADPGSLEPPPGSEGQAGPDPEPLRTGDYVILGEIGRGGMGIVYRARQRCLEREVALKTLAAGSSAASWQTDRFVREALVTGILDHPNIIPVHELGEDDGGRPFLSMKKIRGRPWSALMHPGPEDPRAGDERPDLRQHLEILLKLCDAVAFAHSRGVVHRDLKPENVMVGEFGEVLLMDWGLALDVTPSPSGLVRVEHVREARGIAGTPAYMPPELARGDYSRVGFATDVYLLGAILYEILTSHPPHPGSSVSEVLGNARTRPPIPPSARTGLRDISPELESLAMRALAADPAERIADVRMFQEELRTWMEHRESLRLTEESARERERLGRAEAQDREGRFARYGRILSKLSQALHMWPGNERALREQATAATAYAGEALDAGEAGLAAAQLSLLRAHPLRPERPVALLEAGLATHRTRQRRSAVVLTALVAFLACVAFAVWNGRHELRRQHREDGLAEEFGRACGEAWTAAATGDLEGLRRARTRLEAPRFAAVADREPRQLAMIVAEAVLAWRLDRPADVLEITRDPDPGGAAVPRDEVASWIDAVPRLDRWLETSGGGGPVPVDDLHQALGWLLRTGAGEPEILELLARIERVETAGDPAAPVSAGGEASVGSGGWYRSALRGLRRLAMRELVRRCLAPGPAPAVVPFVMELSPLAAGSGPTGSTGPRPRTMVLREPGGGFVGWDPASAAPRWRRRFLADGVSGEIVVPVTDGTSIVVVGEQVLQIEDATGVVRERSWIDGRGILAWPDPRDRTQLVVLVEEDDTSGFVHPAIFRSGTRRGPLARSVHPATRRVLASGWASLRPGPGPGGAVPAADQARLRAAWNQDPAHPGIACRILIARLEPESGAARELLRSDRPAMAHLPVLEGVRLGCALDAAGLEDEADALYGRSCEAFLRQGGNPDLAPLLSTSPALHLRRTGDRMFGEGRIDRALHLIEIGRFFSTYVEDDHRFYERYRRWLLERGRTDEARRIMGRVRESRSLGGMALLSSACFLTVDVAIVIYAATPFLFLLVLLRIWSRARPTRIADLHAIGIRGRAQRLGAFISFPIRRLGRSSLGYATRSERLSLLAAGMAFTAATGYIGIAFQFLDKLLKLPPSLSTGYTASPAFERFVEDRIGTMLGRHAALKILSDVHRSRERPADARALLEKLHASWPDDPSVENNLGVLLEEAGDREAARERYQAASPSPRPGGAAARFNLSRLSNPPGPDPGVLGDLAHRDRIHAELLPDRPLWSWPSTVDWLRMAFSDRALHRQVFRAAGDLLLGRRRSIFALGHQEVRGQKAQALLCWVAAAGEWSILFMTLVTLIWLPLPSRRLLAAPCGPEASVLDDPFHPDQGPPRWLRRLETRLREGLHQLAWFVPGVAPILRGRILRGVAMMGLATLGLALFTSIRSGGLVRARSMSSIGHGYFPGIPEDVLHPATEMLGLAGGWTLVLILLLTPLVRARSIRGSPGAPALSKAD